MLAATKVEMWAASWAASTVAWKECLKAVIKVAPKGHYLVGLMDMPMAHSMVVMKVEY